MKLHSASSVLLPTVHPTPSALHQVNRAFHAALTHPHLLARIFRLKFDSGAIARRAYTPHAPDLAAQLVSWCHALRVIRTGDVFHEDAEDALLRAWMMMLENDGKNRSQLEWAGVEAFVEAWVVGRLYEDAGLNAGWPRDSPGNACAVWLVWLFTTREKLVAEPPAKRELIVSLLLPFVLVPYRYASSHAPPAHYTLPISSQPDTVSLPGSMPTHHGPYPIYPNAVVLPHHFGSVPDISLPLITTAAKLVYFSRREVVPFGIPPHLPENREEALQRGVEGPTKEDMREVNGYMGARMGDRVVWNWDLGNREVHEAPLSLIPSSTSRLPPPPEDYSTLFDADWWRHRLCGDAYLPRPKILPGYTYTPGSLSGQWQGRLLIPSEMASRNLLLNAHNPQGGLSEMGMEVTTQPVFMRLFEHFALGEEDAVPSSSSGTRSMHVPSGHEDQEGKLVTEHDGGEGMRNAWFPGRIGGVSFSPLPPTSYDAHDRDRVRIRTDYQTRSGPEWVYETFDNEKKSAHREETCERCRKRLDVLEKVRREEREEEERSVGLGSGSGSSSPREEDEEDEDEEEVRPLNLQFEMEGDQNPDGSLLFVDRTRRTHGRAWVPECVPGVGGVCVSGRTDRRHALAWNAYTFYGRVRPWDGLVGILRMARYPAVNHVLFYGYIVNGRNFVGNWRVASADPMQPCWESAFVMSKREV
ncbi:hypothetical protein BDQ17DRAFT_1346082 [Cyathus striatus]|nr:hypothetical protein BDQ17DRAFT_1346082 [Cyathus striatus]